MADELPKRGLGVGDKLTVDSDPSWTLDAWELFIKELKMNYGPRSILSTDAGYNNVDLVIEKRK